MLLPDLPFPVLSTGPADGISAYGNNHSPDVDNLVAITRKRYGSVFFYNLIF